MNLRDLQYLIAVHETGSFSRAAEECFVSQPTLSGQIKKLEVELGSSLIERSTRRILFTQLGDQVVDKAREILLSVDSIRRLAREADDPYSGELHIGLIPTVGPFLLPLIMPKLSDVYPKLKVFLYELKTEDLMEHLHYGKIDVGILAKLDWNESLKETQLYNEQFSLAVSETDSLVTNSQVDLSVLEGRNVLMLEDGHCLREQALGVCFSAGAKEDQRFKATSMDTLLHMVAVDAGMTLIPQLACSPKQGITYIPFKDPPGRDIVMVSRLESDREELLSQVAEHIQVTIKQIIKQR